MFSLSFSFFSPQYFQFEGYSEYIPVPYLVCMSEKEEKKQQ